MFGFTRLPTETEQTLVQQPGRQRLVCFLRVAAYSAFAGRPDCKLPFRFRPIGT